MSLLKFFGVPGCEQNLYHPFYDLVICILMCFQGGVIKSVVACDYVCTIGSKDFYTGENFTKSNDSCSIYKCELVSNSWHFYFVNIQFRERVTWWENLERSCVSVGN